MLCALEIIQRLAEITVRAIDIRVPHQPMCRQSFSRGRVPQPLILLHMRHPSSALKVRALQLFAAPVHSRVALYLSTPGLTGGAQVFDERLEIRWPFC